MSRKKSNSANEVPSLRGLASSTKQILKEPILNALLKDSLLTPVQLETLLIDLVVEDSYGSHIPYKDKASIRTKQGTRSRGVSRGAFNRTLSQARKNVTRCLYTMLLLAYLGLFDFTLFRPFEEIAGRIGDYRKVRDVLAGKDKLTKEDIESYRMVEQTILSALQELTSSLTLKTDLSRKRTTSRHS